MADETQHVIDRSDLRKYRTELPNLYDDADLDPFEFRLLAHYKRVGTCTEGMATTAQKCKMSTGKVSETRKSLAKKKFVNLTHMMTVHGPGYSVEVVDRWEENFRKYSRKPSPHEGKPSPHEGKPSPHEGKPSPGEGKKVKPIKKGQPSKNTTTPTPPPTKPVAVVGEWDLVQLLKFGRATKSRMTEIAAMDPAPSSVSYVAHYLYGMTIHKINAPAHFAAKRIVEQLEAGEPFETLAGLGPRWLTECLHWIFTGGVEYFESLTPQALALRNYLPTEIAARMIPRAFDELGLAAYLPKQEPPEPVGEYVLPERPVLDEWQQAIERMRVHYPPATVQGLEQCKLVGRENGTMLLEVPNPHLLQWFKTQKISASLKNYGVEAAFGLRDNHAES